LSAENAVVVISENKNKLKIQDLINFLHLFAVLDVFP
jgi:hypothetical protein